MDPPPAVAEPSQLAIAPDLADLARGLFDALRDAHHDGVGITRPSYGAGETAAMRRIEQIAKEAGLTCAWDAAGNLRVGLPGTEPSLPAAACGSHLDSVPQAAISTAPPA